MSSTKMGELQGDIDELQEFLKQAKRKKVQDFLTLEIRKLETEWISLKEQSQKIQVSSDQTPPAPLLSATNKRCLIKLNGYGWDQSDKYVKIFVTLKNVQALPKEQVTCNLTEKSMELYVKDLDSKDYRLVINNLLYHINVAESHWKQKTDMVVIFLAKSDKSTKWSHMTEIEKKFEDNRTSRLNTVSEDLDGSDPQATMMSLMKNMYNTGDDDMKRMISKAFYEGQNKNKTDTLDP